MNRYVLLVMVLFIGQFCLSEKVVASQLRGESQKVTARQLKREMSAKSPVYVISVLNKNSFKDCSIPGSVNISMDKLSKRSKKWKHNKPIVVYCASYDCPLSGYAYDLLVKNGFTDVREFAGGIREWYHKKYPVNGKCRAGYLQK